MIFDDLDNFLHQRLNLKMRASVVHYLQSVMGTSDKDSTVLIYFFPNSNNNHVFVDTVNGSLIQTKFALPSWISENVMKILKSKPDLHGGTKNKYPSISDDINELKKEIHMMKKDIKIITKSMDRIFMNMH